LLTARIPDHLKGAPPADPGALSDDEDALTDIDLAELGLLTPKVDND
jgi:segregation and condensation protein B